MKERRGKQKRAEFFIRSFFLRKRQEERDTRERDSPHPPIVDIKKEKEDNKETKNDGEREHERETERERRAVKKTRFSFLLHGV